MAKDLCILNGIKRHAIFQWEMFRWLRNLCRHLLLYLIIRIELNRYYFNILISIFNIKFKNEWRLILNHWFQTLVVWSKKKVRHYFSTYDKKASGYEQSKFIFSIWINCISWHPCFHSTFIESNSYLIQINLRHQSRYETIHNSLQIKQ